MSMFSKKRIPIGGTGRWRWGFGCWYRRPKSTHERRLNQTFSEEGEPEVRARRKEGNLPNAWDDRPQCKQRTWKKYRKTRWIR